MTWTAVNDLKDLLKAHGLLRAPANCGACGVRPGQPHQPGCQIERCSFCGGQLLVCGCDQHDEFFARWTGFYPGTLECIALGLLTTWSPDPERPIPADSLLTGAPSADMNRFYQEGWHRLFFVKPARPVSQLTGCEQP
jgi:hypothetical protein